MLNITPDTETYSLPPDTLDESTTPNPETSRPPDILKATAPKREPIHIILIGPNPGISLVIGILNSLGFAEPRAWSKPQIDPVSGKPMRILTKWLRH
ncbi:MAG: hypothetical protein AAF215_00245 [Cyanobacteria bacterium P01_A01_bin.123]